MSGDESSEDFRALWQKQSAEFTGLTPEEVRHRTEETEKRMRRNLIDTAVAVVLSSIVIVLIAVRLANPLVRSGAITTVGGLLLLAYEIFQHRRRAPVVENGAAASLDYLCALLQHKLEFHKKRLWSRVFTLAPGGLLFFTGFAAARPDLAAFIYFQLATFIAAIIMIVPANRKAAAKLERQIGALQELR